ncbi:hypothetical protein COU37_00315 [Candidatus Micrarchaeota archaeon CG10_big_fil_rev_8_21_14_0_10_45_29]|nr:MAG: hypothetical protein COU37_00315 [Candidatus Micrarchaeota archaeon CG10_big_fil_rev_8_21_14_0_10_45_29]
MDINDAWKDTCKIVLGGEIGDLQKYEKYLQTYVEPIYEKNSSLSQKKVIISRPDFCKNAKFISFDEQEKYNKQISDIKLNLNQIKDIDSILSSISEQFYYAGNQITGNCSNIENSDNVMDSHYVINSIEIAGGKFIAYSSMARFDEYLFGVNWSGQAKYCIKCFETYKQSRCFETLSVWTSSDCYYSARLEGCGDCIFSFNQKHKNNLIGNLQFPKEEYAKRKKALLDQIRSTLESKKRIRSILEIMGGVNG